MNFERYHPALKDKKIRVVENLMSPEKLDLAYLLSAHQSYSDFKSEYLEIDVPFIRQYQQEDTAWKGCPGLYNEEMIALIREVERENREAWNGMIRDRVKAEMDLEGIFVEAVIYTCRKYLSTERAYAKAIDLRTQMLNEGYAPLGDIGAAVGKSYSVLVRGNNGMEVMPRLTLKKMEDGQFGWQQPRYRKQFLRVHAGQLVRPVK